MKQLITPNGDPITGIFEVVPGRALVDGFIEEDGKLQPEYAGETQMYWDEQKVITDRSMNDDGFTYHCDVGQGGDPIYLDDEGNEWRLDQLTVKDDGVDA